MNLIIGYNSDDSSFDYDGPPGSQDISLGQTEYSDQTMMSQSQSFHTPSSLILDNDTSQLNAVLVDESSLESMDEWEKYANIGRPQLQSRKKVSPSSGLKGNWEYEREFSNMETFEDWKKQLEFIWHVGTKANTKISTSTTSAVRTKIAKPRYYHEIYLLCNY